MDDDRNGSANSDVNNDRKRSADSDEEEDTEVQRIMSNPQGRNIRRRMHCNTQWRFNEGYVSRDLYNQLNDQYDAAVEELVQVKHELEILRDRPAILMNQMINRSNMRLLKDNQMLMAENREVTRLRNQVAAQDRLIDNLNDHIDLLQDNQGNQSAAQRAYITALQQQNYSLSEENRRLKQDDGSANSDEVGKRRRVVLPNLEGMTLEGGGGSGHIYNKLKLTF